jgi:hypothetical protein
VDDVAILELTGSAKETPRGPEFDLSRDLRIGANPAGAWQFGWKSTLDGRLTLLSTEIHSRASNGVQIYGWGVSDRESPIICKVIGPGRAESTNEQFVATAGTIYIDPGKSGSVEKFGVARFTVPVAASSSYRVEASVWDGFAGDAQGDSEFHVLKNGSELFGRLVAPHTVASYTNDIALSDGDTIDFVVGAGWDNKERGSRLKLLARLIAGGPALIPPGQPTSTQTKFDADKNRNAK